MEQIINWYCSGPAGSGERHAKWRCYTPTHIVVLTGRADLRLLGACQELSKTPYKAQGPEAGGRLVLIAVREDEQGPILGEPSAIRMLRIRQIDKHMIAKSLAEPDWVFWADDRPTVQPSFPG